MRVVSLVPSLSEAVAATDAGLLVGATDWCTHPAALDVTRGGGTKWPGLEQVLALAPDLVIANAEENRAGDIAALRAAGIRVWVTAPATVGQALAASSGWLPASIDPARNGWPGRAPSGPIHRAFRPPLRRSDLAAAVDGARPGHLRR